ncbi:MAG: thioesterase domain-containing protein [Gemmatimonadota bacterium]|nr:thioesterase domain-containing protein [Gemmatimonadota bacterium]
MTRAEVEAYLMEHIPLSAGMAISVIDAGPDGVTIEAPLAPNVNHRGTAFGGSVAALAILAGWTLVHLRLRAEGLIAHTVIQSSSVRYDAPIHGGFRAMTEPLQPAAWEKFVRTVTRRGKGRVHVSVQVLAEGCVAATFTGAYVAIAES